MTGPLRAGILIGGESRRMGHPKHLCELDGQTFLERILDVVRELTVDVSLLGAGDLPDSCAELERLDDPPGRGGPLAGLSAAHAAYPAASWLLIACDFPLLDGPTLRWLMGHDRAGCLAVMPRINDRPQPLCGLYHPAARGEVERLLAAGRGPTQLARLHNVLTPVAPPEVSAALANANRPDDVVGIDRPLLTL